MKGGITISTLLYASLKLGLRAVKKEEAPTLEELNTKFETIRRFEIYTQIISGLVAVWSVITILYMYKPTDAEMSIALMQEYLHAARLMDTRTYEKLKTFRTLDTLVDFNKPTK